MRNLDIKNDKEKYMAKMAGAEILDEPQVMLMVTEFPEEGEISFQTEQIINKALPEQKPFLKRLAEIYLGPGPKAVFEHCGVSMVIALLVYGAVLAMCILSQRSIKIKNDEFLSLLAFPFLYMIFFLISYWSEGESETIELKQSVHYSFTYLVSLRMFYTGIFSVLVNLVALSALKTKHLWSVCAVGVSSLCLFAILSLYLCHRFGRFYHMLMITFLWLALCCSLAQYGTRIHKFIFETVPLAVHIVVALGCVIGFAEYIRKVERNNAYSLSHY